MKSRPFTNHAGSFTIILPENEIDHFFNDNPPPTPLAKIYYSPTVYAQHKVATCIHWANEQMINEPLSLDTLSFLTQVTEQRDKLLESKGLNDEHYIVVKIIKQVEVTTLLMKFVNVIGEAVFSLHADINPDNLNKSTIGEFIMAVRGSGINLGKLTKDTKDIDDSIFENGKEILAVPKKMKVGYTQPSNSIWSPDGQPMQVYNGWIVPDNITSKAHYDELTEEMQRMYSIEDSLSQTAHTYMKKVSKMLAEWKEPTPAPIAAAQATQEPTEVVA